MTENNDTIESAIRSEVELHQRSVDADQRWTECEEDYEKAKKIETYLLSLKKDISGTQEKTLACAQEFIRNYEESVNTVRNAIFGNREG
jgi:hypothetical protein